MAGMNLVSLVDHIDGLLSEYLELREKPSGGGLTRGSAIDIEDIIEHGAFPPDDPTTLVRLKLLTIGETLGLVGGTPLLHQVYDAYEAKYGHRKAASLSARWDSAAGLWFN